MDEPRRRGVVRRAFGGFWSFIGWLRMALANLVFLVVLIFLITVLRSDRQPPVPQHGALVIDPSGRIVEQLGVRDPLSELFASDDRPPPETLLKDVVDAIDQASADARIAVIVLATDNLGGSGITKTRDIGEALEKFRASGKKVIAIGDSYSQDQYLLAAQADEVWMHPMGLVEVSGIGVYHSYFKGSLDKLKIDMHVFRSGAFKSAFEMLERSDMSDADRLATGELINSIWSRYTALVSERRKLPPGAVEHYANELDTILGRHKGDAGAAALEHGLIDALKSRGEMDAALGALVGKDDDGHFQRTGFRDYLRAVRPTFGSEGPAGQPAVGVLVASGAIIDGEQPPGNVGGDTLAKQIRAAARNPDIKALVLRIDSPGGSGFASEVIREALLEFRASGKPLVASMGSVAASGGYWIAAPADQIWASETTLTGSIGVLSAFPSFARSLESLGITSDGVGTTALAGGLDPTRPLTPQWASVLEQLNRNAYQRFIGVVAAGRSLPEEKVAEVAEGRVWTGEQALENGLVDKLGDLREAIAAAAALAKLETYNTRWLAPPPNWRMRLMSALSGAPDALLVQVFGAQAVAVLRAADPLEPLLRYADPRTPWALCAVCAAL